MKVVLGIFLLAALWSCGSTEERQDQFVQSDVAEAASESNHVGADAVFSATEDSYDFGVITEGEKASHVFEFSNNGTEPLIINEVSASCGCTTPSFSRTPIAPGQKGSIEVVYDSAGQAPGKQHKVIVVSTNAREKIQTLHLRGEVIPK